MNQFIFGDSEYSVKRKQTRRKVFLAEMEQVVPWEALLASIAPAYPKDGSGRPQYPLQTMLRIHLVQNWFGYSDPAMEEALYKVAPLYQFARLSLTRTLPDEATILNFRRRLENHALAPELLAAINAHLSERKLLLRTGTIVDATSIHASSSAKNREGARQADIHQTKKGNQWYFGVKAHIGVDVGYPEFKTVPGACGEYNDEFMCGQWVLRGGSCVTPRNHIRASYRNFSYPAGCWQFGEVRLARDV